MHFKKITLIAFIISLWSTVYAHAEAITLKDKKGNMIIVSPLRKKGDKIIVKRMHDGKEFALSPDILDDKSKNELLKAAEKLAKTYPKLRIDVSIGKRTSDRSDYNESTAQVTAKVSVTNTDYSLEGPPCKGTIILIGRDVKTKLYYEVLSAQKFDIQPTQKGATFDITPFANQYDDNGSYHSGYKYQGYLVVLTDDNGGVIETATASGAIKKSLADDPSLAQKFIKYKKGNVLNKSMEVTDERP